MKTDAKLYQIFSKAPGMLFKLLGMESRCPYTMKSQVFKELEQRSDGILEPTETGAPVYVVEFQASKDKNIYDRLVIEMASYRKTYPVKEIYGILIFLEPDLDPKTVPWHFLSKGRNKGIHVFYLDKALRKLKREEPNHPLVLVFQPYLVKSSETLRKSVKGWYSQLENATIPTETKQLFCNVFFRWLSERFKNLSNEEIYAMLASLTPFEETRVYQELMEMKEQGKIEGKIEGKLDNLRELYTEGLIAKEQFELRTKSLKEQLKNLALKNEPA